MQVTVFLFHCCDNKLWTATKPWYGLIACGLRGRFVVQFTATRRPIKVQEVAQGFPSLTWENTRRYGVHDGRLQEIRSAITGMQGSGSPLSSITNFRWPAALQQDGHYFHVGHNSFEEWQCVFVSWSAGLSKMGYHYIWCKHSLCLFWSPAFIQVHFFQRIDWHKKIGTDPDFSSDTTVDR